MKNLSQALADYLYYELGIEDIFTVTGGGAMFLNDAFGNHPHLRPIYNHHEQASAMAAVGYAKSKENYSLCCVTTGCGCTNAMTGLLDAWQDNVPVIFISGQVKLKDTSHQSKVPLRQLGVQEANIIEIVKSITKYSVMITNPNDIRKEIEKAAYIAKSGRPGPVWIDIPQDIQGSPILWNELNSFNHILKNKEDSIDLSILEKELLNAKRPLILAGNGLRSGNLRNKFNKFVDIKNIPCVFSYLSIDLLNYDSDYSVGRLGTKGDRAGNFAIQNCDLLIVLGCRLSIPLTGFEYEDFARNAKVHVIDIDEIEHSKNTVKIDNFIQCDLKNFFEQENLKWNKNQNWINKCKHWKFKWPVYQKYYEMETKINMYQFIRDLNKYLDRFTEVISDAGSAYYITSQSLLITEGARYNTSGAQADMGYTLPASVGAAIASPNKKIIGITGDGSFQMNIQELQVIKHHNLNIKIIVWNNNGYLSIKTTQKKFFAEKYAGTNSDSGISFPSLEKISKAYEIDYEKLETPTELSNNLERIINSTGPRIVEIICPEEQEVIPNVSAKKNADGSMTSSTIDNMYPYLSEQEINDESLF